MLWADGSSRVTATLSGGLLTAPGSAVKNSESASSAVTPLPNASPRKPLIEMGSLFVSASRPRKGSGRRIEDADSAVAEIRD